MTDQSALARSVAARDELHEQIAREFGLLSAEEADQRLGPSVASTRAGRQLLAIEGQGRLVYPGFQFDRAGVRPVIGELIALGGKYKRSEVGLIHWLMGPTTYLHGHRPVDVLDDPAALLRVAESAFGIEW